jgi:hypothetical protein
VTFTFSTGQPANIAQSEGAMQFETNRQPAGLDCPTDVASCQPNQKPQLGPVEAGGFSDFLFEGEQDFGGFMNDNEG